MKGAAGFTLAFGLAAGVLAGGCPEPGVPDAFSADVLEDRPTASLDSGMAPHLELGTGASTYTPIAGTNAELELILGPQGGWHLEVAVRIFGLDPEGLLLEYRATRPDGTLVSMPSQIALSRRRVVPEGDHFVRPGDRVVLDIEDPSEVVNQVVVLSVTAETPGGLTVDDERSVTVVDRNP